MLINRPENTHTCKPIKLYNALRNFHKRGMDLEFYISEDSKEDEDRKSRILVPKRPTRTRRYGQNLPSNEDSLHSLIQKRYFTKDKLSLDLYNYTGGEGAVFEIDQRKALAIKLVLGLMVSMDSDCPLESWEPRQIHFLEPRDDERTPFVSIPGDQDSTTHQRRFALEKLSSCDGLDEDDDDPKPIPQFMMLAKALLQIARGDHLDSIELSGDSGGGHQETWKSFRNLIEKYTQTLSCGKNIDRETLPFLRAAQGCLDFHLEYPNRLMEANSSADIDIAWKLVFDTVLMSLDGNLNMEGLTGSGTDGLRQGHHIPTAHALVAQEARAIVIGASAAPSLEAVTGEHLQENVAISRLSRPDVELFDAKIATKTST